jgi:tRNA U34 5-methylaminomethyl-2-thiouridine-forming methyltransferase MnmC
MAQIDWHPNGVPVSRQFDDPYYSLDNGLSEARHVFLAGNDLPARFRDGFRIAELGFGTGLNLLATWHAWEQAGLSGNLSYTSFEAYPMTSAATARALAAFPSLSEKAAHLVHALEGGRGFQLGPLTVEIIHGDARVTLPDWSGQADAWFLDGFSPAKNPELWDTDLLQHVARHTSPGGTAATYTAAGFVRRALSKAGFDVIRTPGFGRKRHMTRARLA